MSPEAWIALATGIITILTICFFAGRILGKMDSLVEAVKGHDARLDKGDERMNRHAENLSALNERAGLNNVYGTHSSMGMRPQEQ